MRVQGFRWLAVLVLVFSLAACAAQPTATSVPPSPSPTAGQASTPSVEPSATGSPSSQGGVQLTVFAAASLQNVFQTMADPFKAQKGATLVFNFAGSQQLAQQIANAAPADVFASADQKQMNAAVQTGRIDSASVKPLLYNNLVVVVPQDNPKNVQSLKDLANPGLKLILAASSVPVGNYTLQMLDNAAKDPAYGAGFKDSVLKNVVSNEDNVRSVLTKVSLGEGDAGVVYVSDVISSGVKNVKTVDVPAAINVRAAYYVAALKDSPHLDLANAFVDFLFGPGAQKILQDNGFQPATAAQGSGSITLTDALDQKVALPSAPQRITIAGRGQIMVLDALYAFPSAWNRIVAIGQGQQGTGNFIKLIDPNYASKTILGNQVGPEQIAASQPDVVVMKSYMKSTLGDPVAQLKIPVVYVDFELPDQYARDLTILGQLAGDPARAQQLIQYFQQQESQVTQSTSKLTDAQKPRVLLIYYNKSQGTVSFNVAPLNWMQTQLVEMAGGIPVWKDAQLGSGWTVVNFEQIAAWDPDQIYVVSYNDDPSSVVQTLKADPQWQALRAVKDGKMVAFAKDVYSWDQPDTRWILGLDWLASKMHPEIPALANIDILAQAKSFYNTLYGLDEAAFNQKILPTFQGDLPKG
jgi:iron complex transport system substrate-binding protein